MGAGVGWGYVGPAVLVQGGYVGVGYCAMICGWLCAAWAGEEAEDDEGGRWR